MRILILNWRDPKNPKSGGAEIVTLQHAKAWVHAGHEVTWLSAHFPTAEKIETFQNITLHRRGSPLTVSFHAFLFYLFSGKKFDIVIDEIHGLPFFTPLYVRKPKIAFIHEVAGEIWDYMYPFPFNRVGKKLESWYFSLYKHTQFWTDADSTIDELEKNGIPRSHCLAIPCPADTVVVSKIPKKESDPTFIFISRLVKMKGIESVLNAFSEIHKQEKHAKLWIIGNGEELYVAHLKKIVREKGLTNTVTFFGFVTKEKKAELLRKAHILLHASVKEGWGLVVIEAASQATPAVVYNVPGLRDTVKNKKTGIVLTKNTPEDMADASMLLLNDKETYHKYQLGGLTWAGSLTWEKETLKSLQLLTSVQKGLDYQSKIK